MAAAAPLSSWRTATNSSSLTGLDTSRCPETTAVACSSQVVAPTTEDQPAEQAMHAVAGSESWSYVDASQLTHVTDPLAASAGSAPDSACVPGRQTQLRSEVSVGVALSRSLTPQVITGAHSRSVPLVAVGTLRSYSPSPHDVTTVQCRSVLYDGGVSSNSSSSHSLSSEQWRSLVAVGGASSYWLLVHSPRSTQCLSVLAVGGATSYWSLQHSA